MSKDKMANSEVANTETIPVNSGVIETIDSNYNSYDKDLRTITSKSEQQVENSSSDAAHVKENGQAIDLPASKTQVTAANDEGEEDVSEVSQLDRPVEGGSEKNEDEPRLVDVKSTNGQITEEPSLQVVETLIDTENIFPDPPAYNPSSPLKTDNHSDLLFNNEADQINNNNNNNNNNTSTSEPLAIPDEKTLSENIHQNSGFHRASGDSAVHDYNDKQSLRNRDSLQFHTRRSSQTSELSLRKIDSTGSRCRSIPKPKSSLRDPVYKYQREEFLDNDMLISNSKLDGLLFRLFAHRSHKNGQEDKALPFLDDGKSDLISMDPVTWNLRPMTAVQKETLDSELEFLEDTLSPKQVVRRLFMDGILTHMDYNQIMHTEGQGDKAVVRLLVATLKRRGEKAFPHFLKALKDLDLFRIWDRLDTTVRSLNGGISDDHRHSQQTRSETVRLPKSNLKTHFEDEENSEDILRQFLLSRFDNASNVSTKEPDLPGQGHDDFQVASSRRFQSDQLEQQLNDINTELKALHENLNLLQSSRSSSNVRQSRQGDPTSNTQEFVDTGDSNRQPSAQRPEQTSKDLDQDNRTTRNGNSSKTNDVRQKSGTCAIL